MDEVGRLQQVDVALYRGALGLKRAAQGLDVEQAAVVQAEIEKHLLQIENTANTEERGHVALEDLVHDNRWSDE